ncbi:MAG: hypothetical protein ACF8XB_09090 [Planctomycetota bacterium JB042]
MRTMFRIRTGADADRIAARLADTAGIGGSHVTFVGEDHVLAVVSDSTPSRASVRLWSHLRRAGVHLASDYVEIVRTLSDRPEIEPEDVEAVRFAVGCAVDHLAHRMRRKGTTNEDRVRMIAIQAQLLRVARKLGQQLGDEEGRVLPDLEVAARNVERQLPV